MKKTSKQARLLTMLTLLVLAFLCAFNVTYSYFSSTAKLNADINFYGLDVRFMYRKNSSSSLVEASAENDNKIYLQPATGTISRGETFEFALKNETTPIDTLAIRNLATSCPCYIRFWIDAYVVTNITTGALDTSKNYGKYFFFTENPENLIFTRSNSSSSSSWCYYITIATPPHSQSYSTIELGNTLTFKDITDENDVVIDAIPIDLLGVRLQLSVSMEAVQSANSAFTSIFDDDKGYYKSWR